MSFVNQDDVFRHDGRPDLHALEGRRSGIDLHELYPSGRFPQMPFDESMGKYGNDKPDLRFGLPHTDLTDLVIEHDGGGVPFWQDDRRQVHERRVPPRPAGRDRQGACVVPAERRKLSRAELDKLEEFVKGMGAKGLARAKVGADGDWTQSPLAKTITPELRAAINDAAGAKDGDLLFFQFGKESLVQTVMANLRVHLAKKLGLIPEVGHGGQVEVPLGRRTRRSSSTTRTPSAGPPRTTPSPARTTSTSSMLETDPGKVLCYRYDLVLNGFEIGGGSIRLHDPEVQAHVFRALGITDEEAHEKFGFLLDALRFGAPPHGGIALGMDRLAMLLSGAESLRDVIPFPKTQKGTDLMTDAPGVVAPKQLAELHIRTIGES